MDRCNGMIPSPFVSVPQKLQPTISSGLWLFYCIFKGSLEVLTSDYTDSCRQVLQRRCEKWEILAGRNCAKCCFSIVSWLRRLAKAGPKNGSCEGSVAQDVNKICTAPAHESHLEVKIVKNWQARSSFGSCASQNSHHPCARERFGSQNR